MKTSSLDLGSGFGDSIIYASWFNWFDHNKHDNVRLSIGNSFLFLCCWLWSFEACEI